MRASSFVVATFALAAAAALQPAHSQPRAYRGPSVVCESQDGHYNRCAMPWRGDAQLVQQISDSACVRGRTWGVRRGDLWVDQGCRGRFAPAGYERVGWRPPRGWDHRFGVSCGSQDYHYNFCRVDVGGHGSVHLRRQTSGSACVEGSTWGWNRAGVWVNRGCAGDFIVDRRW
jgi:hypothetical protein